MAAQSDGYALNARIQSSHPIPTGQMVDALATLEADMRMAVAGRSIPIDQWIQWARKDRANTDALLRVLFLTVAACGLSADTVAKLRNDFKNVSTVRRRPIRPIRETGPRESPRLF